MHTDDSASMWERRGALAGLPWRIITQNAMRRGFFSTSVAQLKKNTLRFTDQDEPIVGNVSAVIPADLGVWRIPRQRRGFSETGPDCGARLAVANPSWSARPVDRGVGDISQTPSAESLAGAGMAYRWRMTHRYGCHNRHAGVPPRQNPPDQTQYNAAPAHSPRPPPIPRIRHGRCRRQ